MNLPPVTGLLLLLWQLLHPSAPFGSNKKCGYLYNVVCLCRSVFFVLFAIIVAIITVVVTSVVV